MTFKVIRVRKVRLILYYEKKRHNEVALVQKLLLRIGGDVKFVNNALLTDRKSLVMSSSY